jgi:membrane AbrB-like protein
VPLSTDLGRRISDLAATLLLALAGGALATFVGLPASWLSGAMIAVTAASLDRLDSRLPPWLIGFSFLLIGTALGAGLTPELLRSLGAWPFSLAMLVVSVVLVTLAVRAFLLRVAGWDRDTAFYASIPGALSYVIAVASETAADVRRVAVSQSVRLFLLVAALPLIIIAIEGGPPIPSAVVVAPPRQLLLLVAASLAGGFAFRALKIPGGLLTGSFAASAFLHGAGFVSGTLPEPAIVAGFVLLGALVGSRFVGTGPRYLLGILAPSLGAFFVGTAIALLIAGAVSALTGIPPDQAIVAFAPGGLDAMMSLALALHMDTAYVAAHQFARFAGIAFTLPFIARRARRNGV